MNQDPLVSVVLPVYNGEKYLGAAIKSILEQTRANLELIIVNDGSTDKSESIVRSFRDERIKLFCQENKGLAIALNNGIHKAKGELIARMDADDIANSNRFQLQVDFLRDHPEYILVGGNVRVIDIDGNYLYSTDQPLGWPEIQRRLPHNSFIHSTVLFRIKPFLEAGGYPEDLSRLPGFEDVVLWIRMAPMGKMCNLPGQLGEYRLWPFSGSFFSRKENRVKVSVLNKYFETSQLQEEDKEKIMGLKNNLDKDAVMSTYYVLLMRKKILNGNPAGMYRYFRKALSFRRFSILPYLYLFTGLMPVAITRRIIKLVR